MGPAISLKDSGTATKPQFVEAADITFFFFSVIQTFLLKCLLSGAMGRVLSGPCCISVNSCKVRIPVLNNTFDQGCPSCGLSAAHTYWSVGSVEIQRNNLATSVAS